MDLLEYEFEINAEEIEDEDEIMPNPNLFVTLAESYPFDGFLVQEDDKVMYLEDLNILLT